MPSFNYVPPIAPTEESIRQSFRRISDSFDELLRTNPVVHGAMLLSRHGLTEREAMMCAIVQLAEQNAIFMEAEMARRAAEPFVVTVPAK